METCKFCNGTGEIAYQYHGEYCLDIAYAECPCKEIDRLKFELEEFKNDLEVYSKEI